MATERRTIKSTIIRLKGFISSQSQNKTVPKREQVGKVEIRRYEVQNLLKTRYPDLIA